MKRMWICLSAAMVVLITGTAPAFAALEITRINYNPAGPDTGTRWHINKEAVVITNIGLRSRSLDGWSLHDRRREHVYRFSDLTLGPDEYVRVHSGVGDNGGVTGCNGHCFTYYFVHWDLRHYVWNNRGDVATLRRPNGTIADRCGYGLAASSPKRC